jgi:hypothetical protein
MNSLPQTTGKPVFSQSSLQDYLTCARLYQLRDVEHLSWPAVQSEPALEAERHIQQGSDFHMLVRQFYLGIPVVVLTPMAAGDELSDWWQNFLNLTCKVPELDPSRGEFKRYAEVTCIASFPLYRLEAKYDLVVIHPEGQAVIYDWKTVRKRPSRERLAGAMQTRIYPLVLALAGWHLHQGEVIAPEQIEMQYRFMDDPAQPERFSYGRAQMTTDSRQIEDIINEIRATPADAFDKTADINRCRFCLFRSYCDRGSTAGDFRDTVESESTPLEIDLDNLPEIEI